jgi:hypothetical protein
MRSGAIPFQFDLSDVLKKVRRITSKHVGNITLSLPFVSIAVIPKDREKQVAREIVIRLKDRRVLSAWECCDNCIEQALTSLQEIRRILIDKQVELSEVHDGPLFLLIDAMTLGIRQFLTFEQHLKTEEIKATANRSVRSRLEPDVQQAYFDGLEILRGHLSRCLGQIAVIAGMDVPKDGLIANYQGAWQLEAYKTLQLPDK